MTLADARPPGLIPAYYARSLCCIETPVKAVLRHHTSEARYRKLLLAQGGVCGICGGTAWHHSMGPVPLPIDHNHLCCPGSDSCGRCVRGLLCPSCNGFLGLAELHGNPVLVPTRWIEAARAYLTRAGVDPWQLDRFTAKGRLHRDRRLKAGATCRCYHCTGDLTRAGGWIAAAIAAGEPIWDGIIHLHEQARARAREAGRRFLDDE